MNLQHVLVHRDGPFVTVTLNRPEKRNALALDVMLELTAVLNDIAASDATGVILAANGPVFSAGHDFGDMAGATAEACAVALKKAGAARVGLLTFALVQLPARPHI